MIDATLVAAGGKFHLVFKDETLKPPKKHLRIAMADDPAIQRELRHIEEEFAVTEARVVLEGLRRDGFLGPKLADRVVFNPPFDTKNHSFYNPARSTLSFYGLLPSTRYTMRILPGMRDPYGNAIQSEKTVTFTTRALVPSASLLMPYLSMLRAGGPRERSRRSRQASPRG